MALPALIAVSDIHEQLRVIFPSGTTNRNYPTREISAKTVFVMMYIGAIEGSDHWIRPDQVTRMTDAQAASTSDADREEWREKVPTVSDGLYRGTVVSSKYTRANPRRDIARGVDSDRCSDRVGRDSDDLATASLRSQGRIRGFAQSYIVRRKP